MILANPIAFLYAVPGTFDILWGRKEFLQACYPECSEGLRICGFKRLQKFLGASDPSELRLVQSTS